MPDVGALAVVPVEVVADVFVAAVEDLSLLPPQPANARDAITPADNTRVNPTLSDPIEGAEHGQRRTSSRGPRRKIAEGERSA
jgi:hypothetical protein